MNGAEDGLTARLAKIELFGVTRTALSLAVKRLVACGEIVHPAHGRFVICGIL